jgi:hypothetical protein
VIRRRLGRGSAATAAAVDSQINRKRECKNTVDLNLRLKRRLRPSSMGLLACCWCCCVAEHCVASAFMPFLCYCFCLLWCPSRTPTTPTPTPHTPHPTSHTPSVIHRRTPLLRAVLLFAHTHNIQNVRGYRGGGGGGFLLLVACRVLLAAGEP